jgi:hypothetical protein
LLKTWLKKPLENRSISTFFNAGRDRETRSLLVTRLDFRLASATATCARVFKALASMTDETGIYIYLEIKKQLIVLLPAALGSALM